MSKKIFIIPKAGSKVIDPLTRKPIDSQGQYVDKTTYWARRIIDGDVIQYGPDELRKDEVKKIEVENIEDEKEEQQFEEVGGDQ